MIKLPKSFSAKWNSIAEKYHGIPLKIKILILAVLGLIALISVFFMRIDETTSSTAEAENLPKLSQNIRRHYQNRPDYWGLSTKTVIDNKIAPLSMLKNGRLVSGFDSDVLVGSAPDGQMLMPGARSFDVIYKGLNKKQCIDLAVQKFNETFWLGVITITISNDNGNEVFSWNDQKNILPIKKGAAKQICKSVNNIIYHIE